MQELNLPNPPNTSIPRFFSQEGNTPSKKTPNSPSHSVPSLQKALNSYQDGRVGIPALKACVDLISSNLMLAKKIVVKVDEGGYYEYLPNDKVSMLFRNPSKTMNRFQWEMFMFNSILFKGNAYAYIRRSSKDKFTPVELIPADCGNIDNVNGEIKYRLVLYNEKGSYFRHNQITTSARNVLHFSALNPFNEFGESYAPMYFAFLTATIYGESLSRVYQLIKQGSISRYLQLPEHYTNDKLERWADWYAENFTGQDKLIDFAPLLGGGAMVAVPPANVDPELLELMRFETAEVSRCMGVPQGLIGHFEKGSAVRNANIVTADFTALKKKALLPYAESISSEVERKLLMPKMMRDEKRFGEVDNLEFIFDFAKVDESSMAERVAIAKNMMQSGAVTRAEVRQFLGKKPKAGDDVYPEVTGAPKRTIQKQESQQS